MIKLLALDLDGTLMNSRGDIPEKKYRSDSTSRRNRRFGDDCDGQTFPRCASRGFET